MSIQLYLKRNCCGVCGTIYRKKENKWQPIVGRIPEQPQTDQ